MTLREAIARVKMLKSPSIPDADLIRVISQTEAEILRKIVFPRAETIEFNGYTDADMDKNLQAPFPFDDIYLWGCVKYIDVLENQAEAMNNSERRYKEILGELAAWWVRTHRYPPEHVGSPWWGV